MTIHYEDQSGDDRAGDDRAGDDRAGDDRAGEFDQQLTRALVAGMREETCDLAPAGAVLARARRAHRHRVTAARAATLTGISGLAAATVVLGTSALSGGTPSTGTGSVGAQGTQARSLPVGLVAALTSASTTSYRLHLHNYAVLGGGRPDSDYADYTGVYDPRTKRGSGSSPFAAGVGSFPVRLIGDTFYVALDMGRDKPWQSGKGTLVDALGLDGGRHWGPSEGDSADPAALLKTLRRLGTVEAGKNTATRDLYRFSYPIDGDLSSQPHLMTGTVEVDRDTGLVARLSLATRTRGLHPEVANERITFRTDVDFSDYGVAVDVTAPPADEVTPRGF